MKTKSAFLSLTLIFLCSITMMADDWMGRLEDDIYVMQMSIPGTHDAATGDGFTWGEMADAFGKTQDLNLADQWKVGVRVFDLRPAVEAKEDDTSDLVIYHGILATNTRFADALRLLCDSLKEHPTEFAIVLMRFENDNGGNRSTWNKLMTELLNSDEMADKVVDFTPRLTLGDVRGKLLIASRDAYASMPVGAFISGWSHSALFDQQKNAKIRGRNTSCTLYAQDFYELTGNDDLKNKVDAITIMLNFSTKLHTRRTMANYWVINHCSGYTVGASADGNRECASTTNKAVIDYLAEEDHQGPTGIIMMDFAGVDHSGKYDVHGKALVEAIIENNFHYEAKATGIELMDEMDAATPPSLSDTPCYDYQGRRVMPLGRESGDSRQNKGVVILNGKKFLRTICK